VHKKALLERTQVDERFETEKQKRGAGKKNKVCPARTKRRERGLLAYATFQGRRLERMISSNQKTSLGKGGEKKCQSNVEKGVRGLASLHSFRRKLRIRRIGGGKKWGPPPWKGGKPSAFLRRDLLFP